MKIVVLGCKGQVGRELCRSMLTQGIVIPVSRAHFDFTDHAALEDFFKKIRPDLVINAAAYTKVDLAEDEVGLAFLVNAVLPEKLADFSTRYNFFLIHLSTDYVFDGQANAPYKENSFRAPLNEYGRSKKAGEDAVVSTNGRYLIFRTSWVYSSQPGNFYSTMIRLFKEQEEIRVVNDQTGSPTWSANIADALSHVVAKNSLKNKPFVGIYNLSSEGQCSWYEFAASILDEMKEDGSEALSVERIKPIRTDEYPLKATRPMYSKLCNEKVRRDFGLVLPAWCDALKSCVLTSTNG